MISAIQKILELLIVKDQQNSPTVTIILKTNTDKTSKYIRTKFRKIQ